MMSAMIRHRGGRGLVALAGLSILAGCASAPSRQPPAWEPVTPTAYAQPAAPTAGAIYRANGGMSLFQDTKARNPGDILTIVLSERTQSRSSANTSVSKNSSVGIEVPNLAGGPVTLNGRNVLGAELNAGRDFSGSGDTAQSNQLTGSLTVTVVDRMPNGNLIVQGEKQLRLNQGDEVVRVQGVVRPADIAPNNTIDSSRVADARIVYAGRGSLGDANAQGWLSRFFNSRWMPF